MPELDGCAASAEIRSVEGGRARVPIIAVTAHAMEDDTTRFLAAGIDRHLTKPLRKSALVEVLLHFCPPEAVLGTQATHSTAA